MKTVLYEDRIKHKLMTFDDIKDLLDTNIDYDAERYIWESSKDMGGHIAKVEDPILNWCNKVFDELHGDKDIDRWLRDNIIRSVYEDLRSVAMRYVGADFVGERNRAWYKGIIEKSIVKIDLK